MVGAQVVDLLVPDGVPELLADKLEHLERVLEARLGAAEALGEAAPHVEADRLHAAAGHVGLVRLRERRRDMRAGVVAAQLRDNLVGAAHLEGGAGRDRPAHLKAEQRVAGAVDERLRRGREGKRLVVH